jgi:imidazolonepropionase-like amidohydrolase
MHVNFLPNRSLWVWLLACAMPMAPFASSTNAEELQPPGFRPLPLGVHALVGGKVVVKPGQILEGATIVIRDGLIKAVGKDAAVPADARVWDMNGSVIYAGFIEPYLVLESTNPPVSTTESEPVSPSTFAASGVDFYGVTGPPKEGAKPGPGYAVARITPQHRAVRDYFPKEKTLAPLRELGFTTAVLAPGKGIIRGTSALVALAEEDPNQVVIKSDVFQHIAFEPQRGNERAYPDSLMGVIAVVRQSLFDAQHYSLDHADYDAHPQNRKRPEFNPALEALKPTIEKKMRIAIEPGSALMVDRASRVAAELGIDVCIVSCGQEWRRPDLIKSIGATFIVPLDFPVLPKLPNDDDWEQVNLDQLRAWDWAAENPAVLRRMGHEIALTTYGLAEKKKFRTNLLLALDRGLTEDQALAALTTTPAGLCGVDDRLGTIEPGKLANLTIVQGDGYFNPDSKVRSVWIDGRVYLAPPEETPTESSEAKPSEKSPPGQPTPPPTAKEEPEKTPKPPEIARQESQAESAKKSSETTEEKPNKKDKKQQQARELQKNRVARLPGDERGPLTQPKSVLIRGATIWTCGPAGRLENADLLVSGGKINSIGSNLPTPSNQEGAPVIIEGQALHVTPGLIDCHSHSAILGAVNESTLPSTAMVRIHDVVNSETDNLYEQLAGGVTMANLLHGSANPIGGQNCVIKLRDGAAPEDLVFEAAPPGIKFALGENVKQSNWGEKFVTRFPQTRMGVRTFIANRFTAAQQYLADWDAYRKLKAAGGTPTPLPPRRDLELETLGEILQGKRWIHCHSYRQDEILMLIRLMDRFGVKIGTFQHVLEGYKVADEIARHGAGASTFSDWWAYKFEVYDAIPYNGSLMRQRGVVVSFNSDSSELARHLYSEAAKAVKYGGTPEIEALKFVTINPARQLHIDSHVGSLEPGKDADFVIWSKSPLDSGIVCLQTWIDGKKYFDHARNADRVAKLQKERAALLVKAKQVAKVSSGGGDSGTTDDAAESFFRVSLEHQYDGLSRGCLDENAFNNQGGAR